MQKGDYFKSLRLAEALSLNTDPPQRTAVDRVRIASIVAMGPRLANVITHDGKPIASAAFRPVKDQLATVGRDRRLRVWAVPSGKLTFMTEPFDEPPSHVQFAPDGERIPVASSEFSHARLLSASNGELQAGPIPHLAGGAHNQPLSPRFDKSGKLLVTQSAPHILKVWGVDNAWPFGSPLVCGAAVAWMNFSADGERVLVRIQDGRMLAGEWPTGRLVEVSQSANDPLFTSDEDRGGDGSSPGAGDRLSPPRQSRDPTRSPESDAEASHEPRGQSGAQDTALQTLARSSDVIEPREASGVRASSAPLFGHAGTPQGTNAIAPAARITKVFYDLSAAAIAYPREMPGVTFDRDRKRLLTFGRDRSARLWDAATGASLLPPIEHVSPVQSAVLSPDGARFATVTAAGRVRVLSTCANDRYVTDVAVSGFYAYVVGSGAFGTMGSLEIVDISQPENPTLVSRCDTSGYANGVAVLGRHAYVADGEYFFGPAGGSRYGGVVVIDVGDPLNPRRVGGNSAFFARDVAVSGGNVFAATYDGRVVLDKFTELRFGPANVEPDGKIRLPIEGACGQRVKLQRSENLVDWEDWQTMTLGGTGCGLIDTTTAAPHRFYRVVEDKPSATD